MFSSSVISVELGDAMNSAACETLPYKPKIIENKITNCITVPLFYLPIFIIFIIFRLRRFIFHNALLRLFFLFLQLLKNTLRIGLIEFFFLKLWLGLGNMRLRIFVY